MSGRLQDQVAVVTGGGRGIGRGIAACLLEDGASVVIAQRDVEQMERVAAELSQLGPVSFLGCDVSQRDQVQALCDHAVDTFGGLDIMVANAGIAPPAPFLAIDDQEWHRTLDVNLKGPFLCGQIAARHMVAAGTRGRIILTSSICATGAEPNSAHYSASKGGVSGLCKGMAVDLARHGIVTNAVAPGWIRSTPTELTVKPAMLDGEERFPMNPVGRIGLPEDIGRAVAFLADPRTTFVSGEVLVVDGAQTAYLDWIDESGARQPID